MRGTRYPNAEEHPPSPPSKGGRAKRRGDVIPSKGGMRKRSVGKTDRTQRRSSLLPRAVSRRSSERGERKSGCPSEASYLIFRPASVAKSCEAHEALTFWLLLGQAKSDKKEILRFALNDKVGENYELQITNYEHPLCHSEHNEESRGEKGRDSSLFF